jgi:hypothetical protein
VLPVSAKPLAAPRSYIQGRPSDHPIHHNATRRTDLALTMLPEDERRGRLEAEALAPGVVEPRFLLPEPAPAGTRGMGSPLAEAPPFQGDIKAITCYTQCVVVIVVWPWVVGGGVWASFGVLIHNRHRGGLGNCGVERWDWRLTRAVGPDWRWWPPSRSTASFDAHVPNAATTHCAAGRPRWPSLDRGGPRSSGEQRARFPPIYDSSSSATQNRRQMIDRKLTGATRSLSLRMVVVVAVVVVVGWRRWEWLGPLCLQQQQQPCVCVCVCVLEALTVLILSAHAAAAQVSRSG